MWTWIQVNKSQSGTQNKITNTSKQKNMQNSKTSTEQREKLHGQNSTDPEIKESYPLLTRDEIQYTPFHVVGNEEIGYKVTWGKYNFMDEPVKTIEEAEKWLALHQWEVTMMLIAIGFKIAGEHEQGANQPKE